MNATGQTALALLPFLFSLLAGGCVADAPFKVDATTVPEQLNDGWNVGSPEDANISSSALEQIYTRLRSEEDFYNVKSLLVVKDGKLLFETYVRDPQDRDRYGHVQSVTKTITSLVFGIVRSEGYIDSLDRRLYSIMPEKFPADETKRTVTLRHLLTMTGGQAFYNDDFSVELYGDRPDDPVKYILNKPSYAPPGREFRYRDCDPHLISHAIRRLTGKTEEEWAADRLFGPLGITQYYWDADPTGTSMGAHGLHLRPRDMAKIGQLALDHGRWGERQIVDSAWLALSTSRQIATTRQTEPHVYDYGFYWWVLPRWNAFTAWGHGGNFIFVLPAKKMVIVMTSLPDVDDEVVGTSLEDFEDLVEPIIGS